MFLSKRPRKGINYYLVVKTYRKGETVRQKTILYLGRLDNLTPERRIDLERKIKDVCDEDILQDFRRELYALGYSEELVPLEEFIVHNSLDHGDVFVQVIRKKTSPVSGKQMQIIETFNLKRDFLASNV